MYLCLGKINKTGYVRILVNKCSSFNQSKLHRVVERLGLRAGEGVQLVVAAERLLVKEGSVGAEERPLVGVDDVAGIILDRETNVEELKKGFPLN